jgi:hypothetical protein
MTTNTFEISLYSINDEEITLEVLAEYLPPIRGSRDRFGAPEEPDEDESWEVLDISYLGKSVTDEDTAFNSQARFLSNKILKKLDILMNNINLSDFTIDLKLQKNMIQ